MQLLSNSSKLSLYIHNGRHLAVSARVDINRVYIRGHLVDDDDGGVTSLSAQLRKAQRVELISRAAER